MALVLSFFCQCLGHRISNMKAYDAVCGRRAVARVGWSCQSCLHMDSPRHQTVRQCGVQVDFCAVVAFKHFLGQEGVCIDYRGYKKHQDKTVSQNTPRGREDSASGLALQLLCVSELSEATAAYAAVTKLFKSTRSTGSRTILVSIAIPVGSTVSHSS